jgi:hypothetical protein
MKITNIKITIFSAFIISLSLFSTAYAAIPGNCKQIFNGENCGSGNRIVSDGCATDAQVNAWDAICKAKVPANSYEVSCNSTLMSAGANPTCSWIGSCPVGQVYNGSSCVESCSPGFISYTNGSGVKSCKRIATMIYDEAVSLFKATYDYVSWLDIGVWLKNGNDISYSTGSVGINTIPSSGAPNFYKLDVNGNTNITGKLNVTGDTTIGGNLTVTGDKKGLAAKYVGLTAIKKGANGGYANADAFCTPVSAGSHICTAKDMTNSYVSGVTMPSSGVAWINNGPPGYVKYVTNDCDGWNSSLKTIFGSVWNFSKKASYVADCGQSVTGGIPFACCK